MPVLVLAVPVNFHKLLENCSLAAIASLRKLRRVMVMTIHVAIVLVVAVLCAKDRGTQGACEMVDVILSVESGDVGASKSTTALETK